MLSLVVPVLAGAAVPDRSVGVRASERLVIPLRDGWRFRLGDDAAWAGQALDVSAWETVTIPHDWSILGAVDAKAASGAPGGFVSTGMGWYRRTFTLPASARGRRVFAEFDGVFMNSAVWINGVQVGSHPYGYSSFSYDLTARVKVGGAANVLAVRVDNSLQPASRWYTGSGIYRPVRLVVMDQTHFDRNGIFITCPEVNSALAKVQIESRVSSMSLPDSEKNWGRVGENRRSKTLRVRSTLFAPDGSTVAATEADLAVTDFSRSSLVQNLDVPTPQLWSAATPALYTLGSELLMDGRVVDAVRTTVGLRRVVYTPEQGMRVNGRPEQLKGVCLHQDAGPLGVAFLAGAWELRLRQLKAMGCNAVRTSHHPFAPEFLDLCDRLGVYVLNEAFDEWRVGHDLAATEDAWGKSGILYGYHRLFDAWWRIDLGAMILRDRNHPCVVMYSIGNEIPDQRVAGGLETLKELQELCHRLDPTRPVTMGNDWHQLAERNGLFDAIDIAGYNYIDRVAPTELYAAIKREHPRWMLLGTETYYYPKCWNSVRDNPCVIGEFLWVGYDYLGESQGWPVRGWDGGMIDIASFEKPVYYHRLAMWSDVPMAYLVVNTGEPPRNAWDPPHVRHHWNWQGAAAPVDVEVYSNCDEIELLLNGRSLGRRAVDKNEYRACWKVPFAAGTLEAVAYRNGAAAAKSLLRTAGKPAALAVEALTAPAAVGSEVITNLRVSVVDAAGVCVPEARDRVTFTVAGPARIRATAAGDLTDHEPYPSASRAAFQGRCLAVIQATGDNGGVTVTAAAPGLQPATVRLTAAKP